MLTVAVCDLFFVLHFTAFRAWPSQPLGPHSYDTVHRPATTARFGTYGCLLPTIRNPPPTQATARDKCYGCRLIGSQESVLAFLLRPLARRRQTSSVCYAVRAEHEQQSNSSLRKSGATATPRHCGVRDAVAVMAPGVQLAASNNCICTFICTGRHEMHHRQRRRLSFFSRLATVQSREDRLQSAPSCVAPMPALRIQWTARDICSTSC